MYKRLMSVALSLIILLLSSCSFSSRSPGVTADGQQKDQEVSQMEFDENEFSTVFQFGDDVIELGRDRVKDLINMGYEVVDKQDLMPDNQFFGPVLVTFKKGDMILPITVYVYYSFRGDINTDYFPDGITYSVFLQSKNLPDDFSYHGEVFTNITRDTIKAWSGLTDDDIEYEMDSAQYIGIDGEKVNAYFERDQKNVSKLEVAISRDILWKYACEFEESLGFRKSRMEADN